MPTGSLPRSRVRRSVSVTAAGAALATLFALVAAAAPASAGTAATRSTAEPGARGRALAALARVEADFAPVPAARAGRPVALKRDVTLDLRALQVSRSALTGADRARADRYLASTSTAQASCTGGLLSGSVLATPHFCLHYTTAGPGATTPEQVQLTADVLEQVRHREVDILGYRAPLPDGDGLLDVTLSDLGNQGIYGYCTTDSSAAQSSASCALDNDFAESQFGAPPGNSLRVTAAHEFFHAIQFAYNADQDIWFMEGTAVWMEDVLYPNINDYLQYLPFSAIREPRRSTDDPGTLERYGSVLWWKFLDQDLGDRDVIRRIWEACDATTSTGPALSAVRRVLHADGLDLARTYSRFAVWNTIPPLTSAIGYHDARLFPQPKWWFRFPLRPDVRTTGLRSVSLKHLSSAAARVIPARGLSGRARLRVRVVGPPRSTRPMATVQLRMRDGALRLRWVPLNVHGNGYLDLPFSPKKVRAAVVTLTNANSQGLDDLEFRTRIRLLRS